MTTFQAILKSLRKLNDKQNLQNVSIYLAIHICICTYAVYSVFS